MSAALARRWVWQLFSIFPQSTGPSHQIGWYLQLNWATVNTLMQRQMRSIRRFMLARLRYIPVRLLSSDCSGRGVRHARPGACKGARLLVGLANTDLLNILRVSWKRTPQNKDASCWKLAVGIANLARELVSFSWEILSHSQLNSPRHAILAMHKWGWRSDSFERWNSWQNSYDFRELKC